MVRGRKPKFCVYCQKSLAATEDTRDHVIPESLFPKPLPVNINMITVPCCDACNKSFQMDEGLFRATILFGEAGISEEGQKIWQTALGRTFKGGDKGLQNAIGKSFEKVMTTTQSGILLGSRLATKPDWSRLGHIIEKIVRGLYYFEYREILPLSAGIEFGFFSLPDFEKYLERLQQMNAGIDLLLGKRQWPGVFRYKYNRVAGYPNMSMWLMLFYDTNFIVAFTQDT